MTLERFYSAPEPKEIKLAVIVVVIVIEVTDSSSSKAIINSFMSCILLM